jgi:hypothetical protein
MLFFFGCENIKMAGVTSPFSLDSKEKFQVTILTYQLASLPRSLARRLRCCS